MPAKDAFVISIRDPGLMHAGMGESVIVCSKGSEIDDDVALGLGAADQHIAVRRCIDRVGAGSRPSRPQVRSHKCGRPPFDTTIARVRRTLRQARAGSGTPAPSGHSDRSGRTRPAAPRREVRPADAAAAAETRRRPGLSDGPAPKISVWMRLRSDAPGCEAGGQIAHEGGRSADIEIGIARHAQLLEHPHVQASASVEIYTWPILGIGRAVANVAVAVGQSFEEGARLLGKRMLAAVAGAV